MKLRVFGLLIALCFSGTILNAQHRDRDREEEDHSVNNWLELWRNPAANFFVVKNHFDSSFADVEQEMRAHRGQAFSQESEKEEGGKDGTFRLFRRWEWYYAPRVGVSGDLTMPAYSYINFFAYLEQNPAAKQMRNASIARELRSTNWSFVGPTGAPQNGGAGRLNFVRFDPNNNSIIYVGAPAGGLWKTTNGGVSWTCLTDYLPIIGCSDLAIDPGNTQVLYLGTGDNDGGDMPSLGVLKSTDGGITWNSTGMNFNIIQNRKVARLIIDPSNTNIVYCGTSAGIYKTYDAGANWSQVTGSGIQDMEMKPGDPQTLYACRGSFIKTTNGGATWTTVTSGLPQSNQVSRLAIAVTKDDPNYVYVVAGNGNTQGFEGIYLSTNSGQSFTPRANSPNLLGWDPSGGDTDGQAWYDLAIAVAPYNKDVVVVGGVNVWRSDDGGFTWNLNAHWYGGGGVPYVHADIHALEFLPGATSTLYVGCDGGIFMTNDDGASYTDLSNNLCIAQIYKMGQSVSDPQTVITGHQDNGTNLKVPSAETNVLGGDGMDCFIDRVSDFNLFGSIYYGDYYKSNDGGQNWGGCTNGLSGNFGWVSPWKQDPVDPNKIYCGSDQLFVSTTQGNSWTQMGTLSNGGPLVEFEIAPSNTQYIYLTNGSTLWRTTNAGGSYTNITSPINTSGAAIQNIAVSPYDENMVWVCLAGYTNNSKVFFSSDAGTTWINISYGLPNIPANAIKAIPNTGNNLVFVGMDAGVYYRHDNSNGWQPYFSALPLAPISDLEVYEATMTLRASTYGRGVWEVGIDASLLSLAAQFTVNDNSVCPGTTVQFTDQTTNTPTQWSWNFPGGNPSSSTAQNPSVVYSIPGTYAVTLTASNASGSDVQVQNGYITVSGSYTPPFFEGFVNTAFLPADWTAVNNANQTYFWQRSNTVGHNSTNSAWFNNHSYNSSGTSDDMISPGISLIGYTNPQLTFDVAYARYNANRADTLEVFVSADCGATWTSVYEKGGTMLSTVPDQVTPFTPTNSQWRTETVSLSAYANAGALMIRFRNENDHGNNLYIDNINLNATVTSAPGVTFFSQGGCVMDSVYFTGLATPGATSWSWSFPGASPATSAVQHPATLWTAPGTYTVTLIASNSIGSDTVTQTVTVHGLPSVDAGADSTYCSTTYVQLSGSGGTSYNWMPSANLYNASNANPNVYLTASTTFTMTATDSLGCSSTDTVRISILPLPGFTIGSSVNNICPGDTLLMWTAQPQHQYTWTPASSLDTATNDSTEAWPMTTTTYTIVSVDTATGCSTSATKTITVYAVTPTPTVLVWGWQLTCSVGGASYQWFFNGNPIPGATQQTYLASQLGMYQVEAYNVQNCPSGISPAVLVDAIPEIAVTSFSAYPNPTTGEFWITFNGEKNSDYTLEIFNAEGKAVVVESINQFSGEYRQKFDLSNYGAGVYMIRLSHDGSASAYRMIVY
jgi:PKD repeat protein